MREELPQEKMKDAGVTTYIERIANGREFGREKKMLCHLPAKHGNSLVIL